MKRMKIKNISKPARLILYIGLPLVVISLFYILYTLEGATPDNISWIFVKCIDMLEYAMMSLTLVVGGAFLADSVATRRPRRRE